MFADVPRGDLDSWKKPPRVVDDIGWGEEVPAATEDEVEPAFEVESFDGDIDPIPEEVAEKSERPRRRRRRRGSRRPDNVEDVAPRIDRDIDEVESIAPGDEYSEPDTFEVDLTEGGEAAIPADPERRSNRRRRRGRKRTPDEAAPLRDDGELNAELASERPGDRPAERLPERGPRTGDRSGGERSPHARGRGGDAGDRNTPRNAERAPESRSSERGTERGDRPPRPERSAERSAEGRSPEGRREKRSERSEPRADRPPRVREERPMPPRSDIEEHEEVDGLEDVDSESGGDKHRNIPSWADSLQAIIEGNMENHKRNDNRGGPPRGRPRSRR